MDEVVKSIDALSRQQLRDLLTRLGLSGLQVLPRPPHYRWPPHLAPNYVGERNMPYEKLRR